MNKGTVNMFIGGIMETKTEREGETMEGKELLTLEAARNALDGTLGEFRVLADMLENLPNDDASYLMARDNLCQRTINHAVTVMGDAIREISTVLDDDPEATPEIQGQLDEIFAEA